MAEGGANEGRIEVILGGESSWRRRMSSFVEGLRSIGGVLVFLQRESGFNLNR